jgi:DNA-binding beta-propeller fold protein YncE
MFLRGRLVLVVAAVMGVLGGSLVFSGAYAFAAAPSLKGEFGSFTYASGVAVDEATGNVFVANGNGPELVDVFGEAGGAPAGGAPATLTKSPPFKFGPEPVGVAVDNSASAAKGTIYVTDVAGDQALDLFKLSGSEFKFEGAITGEPAAHFGEPIGAATDGDGDMYVSDYGNKTLREYSPAGAEIASFSIEGEERTQGIAVDTKGDMFVQQYGISKLVEVKRASDTATTVESTTTIAPVSTAVAIDRATNTLYVDTEVAVIEYSLASGKPVEVSKFGEGSLVYSFGVAVNEAKEKIYVTDRNTGKAYIYAPSKIALLTVHVTGEGDVKSNPVGIECASEECSAEFEGTVTLTATPKAGSGEVFAGWLGCKHASHGTCEVDMSAASEVTAVFLKEGTVGKEGKEGKQGPTGANGGQGEKGPGGASGSNGAPGPAGPAGPAGKEGPAGQVQLVTCKKAGKKQKCTTKTVSGTVTFKTASVHATLSRHGVVLAAGTASASSHGHISLRLMSLHKLAPGRYTLTLTSGTGSHKQTHNETFTLN